MPVKTSIHSFQLSVVDFLLDVLLGVNSELQDEHTLLVERSVELEAFALVTILDEWGCFSPLDNRNLSIIV